MDNKHTLEVFYQEEQSHVNTIIEDDPIDHLQDDEVDGEEIEMIWVEENDFIETEKDFINDSDDDEEKIATNEEEAELFDSNDLENYFNIEEDEDE